MFGTKRWENSREEAVMAAAADSAEEIVIAIAAVAAEIAPISTQESKYTHTS